MAGNPERIHEAEQASQGNEENDPCRLGSLFPDIAVECSEDRRTGGKGTTPRAWIHHSLSVWLSERAKGHHGKFFEFPPYGCAPTLWQVNTEQELGIHDSDLVSTTESWYPRLNLLTP